MSILTALHQPQHNVSSKRYTDLSPQKATRISHPTPRKCYFHIQLEILLKIQFGNVLDLRLVCLVCCICSTNEDSLCQALDCFTGMLSHPQSRLQMAEIIGSKLNISKEKVLESHQCFLSQDQKKENSCMSTYIDSFLNVNGYPAFSNI